MRCTSYVCVYIWGFQYGVRSPHGLVFYLYFYLILFTFFFWEILHISIPRPLNRVFSYGVETILAIKVSTGIAGYFDCEANNIAPFTCTCANFFVPLHKISDSMETKHYETDELTIVWKPDMCTHAGVCVRSLPKVYNPKERPWCKPENATTAELMAQIDACPSKALSYILKNKK